MKSWLLPIITLFCLSCEKNHDSTPPPVIIPATPTDTLKAWMKHQANVPNFINDIAFVDPRKGFIISGPGILRSLDSGKTWTTVPNGGQTKLLASLYFYDQQNGYTIGAGTYGYTTDGGSSWTFLPLATDGYDVFFISPTTGYYVGVGGLYRTTDRGTNWTRKINEGCLAVYFKNSTEGWASTMAGGLYKTVDGGLSWTPVPGTFPPRIMAFGFSGQFGLASASGTFHRTTDNGASWQTLTAITSNWVDIDVLSPTLIYASVRGQILKSVDGGNSWTVDAQLATESLAEIDFLDSLHGWACGSQGNIFRYIRK